MSDLSLTRANAEELANSTFVHSVRFFDEVASTNDVALAAKVYSDELPGLFITPHQTAGRGRGTNRWVSTAGALTFSLRIDPTTFRAEPASWPQLSLWTALGIRDAIASLAPESDVQLKWPNDVFLRQRKVCGILIESVPTANDQPMRQLVVGIGINVHNAVELSDSENTLKATADSPPNAISLGQIVPDIEIIDVARIVLRHLEESWNLFAADESLPNAWQPHCFLSGRSIRWQAGERSEIGTGLGIGDDGALLIQTSNSPNSVKCYGGTVTYT